MLFRMGETWTGRVLSESVDGCVRLSQAILIPQMVEYDADLPCGYGRVHLVDVDPEVLEEMLIRER